MKFIRNISLLLAAVGVLSVSCNKTAGVADEPSQAVMFSVAGDGISVDVETKATPVTAANISPINVMAVTGTPGTSEVTAWSGAFNDSTTPGQFVATAGDRFWPATGDPGWKFYACNMAMTPSPAGPTVAATASTDVVCAFQGTPTPRTSNTLVFDHILARINNVTVNAQTGYTISNVVISIVPNVSGTYNMFTGLGQTDGTGWSGLAPGSATVISRPDGLPGVQTNDLWLVPGSYSVTASWRATKGDSVQDYADKAQTVAITASKLNNLVTTLGGNASEVVFSVTVNEWTDLNVPVNFPVD